MTHEELQTQTVSMSEIMDAILDQQVKAWAHGTGNWLYVRVWPGEGGKATISVGEEITKRIPESEYFQKGEPYPVTVWSTTDTAVGVDDGVFCWEECEENEAEFWVDDQGDFAFEKSEQYYRPHWLDRSLVGLRDGFDDSSVCEDEIRQQLHEAGYTIED